MRIYLDCDGVLADFDAHFTSIFGHPPRVYEEHNGTKAFWRDIQAEAPNFYKDLPLMDDAMVLVEYFKPHRPLILTGCPRGDWAETQKIRWGEKHVPGIPVITCKSRNKSMYCEPGDVLIDDTLTYRDLWLNKGGIFIHHTSAAESIAIFEQIYFEVMI